MMYLNKRFYHSLLLTLPIMLLGCALNKKKPQNISFKAADAGKVSIFIVLKDLPKEKFLFTMPEIFAEATMPDGMFNADRVPWIVKSDYIYREISNENYGYRVELRTNEIENSYFVNWEIKFINNSKNTLRNLSAFNCLTMHHAPLFKDTTMVRTYTNDAYEKTILVKEIKKTQGGGRRTMQFYPLIGGIDLSQIPWVDGWKVTAPEKLSGKSMWLFSKDKSWKVETKVDGNAAFFFNNWEPDHGCIHSAPLIAGELKPNTSAIAKGSFIFTKLITQ